MAASIIALITTLIGALAPIAGKLILGQMTVADAKAAASKAVSEFQAAVDSLPNVEAADDAAADDAAGELP